MTTFVKTSRAAILSGIFMIILGFIFQQFLFANAYVGYIWWDGKTNPNIWKVLIFLPFFNFGKLFMDFSLATAGTRDILTQTFIPGPGFFWSDLYAIRPSLLPTYDSNNPRIPNPPIPADFYGYLIMNIFFYGLLTLYFDKILPDEFGRRQSIFFPFDPRYWLAGYFRKRDAEKRKLAVENEVDGSIEYQGNLDSDVLDEKIFVKSKKYTSSKKILVLI